MNTSNSKGETTKGAGSWMNRCDSGRTWVGDRFGMILLNSNICPYCLGEKSLRAKSCNKCKSKSHG